MNKTPLTYILQRIEILDNEIEQIEEVLKTMRTERRTLSKEIEKRYPKRNIEIEYLGKQYIKRRKQ